MKMRNLKYDPIEDSEEYKKIVAEVNKKAWEKVEALVKSQADECKNEEDREFVLSLPTFHRFEYEKKKILRDEYGIEWKSCIELNPDVNFD
jgi:coenzyme F420-reducing hydrogenase beta subunit